MARWDFRAELRRFEAAAAMLVQAQAVYRAVEAEYDKQSAELRRERAERERRKAECERRTAECFARIEALLLEQTRLLRDLPEAICAKLGWAKEGAPAGAQSKE